jgi:hypothetical protein
VKGRCLAVAIVCALGCAAGAGRAEPPAGPVAAVRALRVGVASQGFGRSMSPLLGARVDAVSEAFAARGTQRLAEAFVTFLREGTGDGFRVHVDRAQCVGFVGVGREGLVDLNLRVLSAAGAELDQDTRIDAHPYVRVCAPQGEALHVRAQAVRGSGEVAVLLLANPPVVAPPLDDVLGPGRANGLFSGPRAPRGEIGRDPSAPSASVQLRRALDALSALGATPLGETFDGALPRQGITARPFALQPGRCYVALAFGEAGVEDLDLRVSDPVGRPLTQDVALDAHPSLRFCTTRGGPHRVDVRMYAGAGRWALGLAALPESASAALPADVTGVARARGAEVAAQALARGMRPVGDALRGAPWGSFVQGFAVPTRRGRCYLVGAAGNESLPALDLWLSGPDGAMLASDTNERERAVVYHCAARDAVLTANVRAHAGRGEYVVMRFEGEVAP